MADLLPSPAACPRPSAPDPPRLSPQLALAGHDHLGGYASIQGRHFCTLEALLESPPDGNAYALLHLYPDRLVIEGIGTVTSRVLAV